MCTLVVIQIINKIFDYLPPYLKNLPSFIRYKNILSATAFFYNFVVYYSIKEIVKNGDISYILNIGNVNKSVMIFFVALKRIPVETLNLIA